MKLSLLSCFLFCSVWTLLVEVEGKAGATKTKPRMMLGFLQDPAVLLSRSFAPSTIATQNWSRQSPQLHDTLHMLMPAERSAAIEMTNGDTASALKA